MICDDSKPSNSFTWGEIVLIALATIIIAPTAYFSKAWSWKNTGLEINLLAIVLINLLLAIALSFVLSGVSVLTDVIKYSIVFFSFTLGSLAVMFVTSELIYLVPCFALHRGIHLKVFTFRYMDMIGLLLGIGLTTAWWLTSKNYIISDVIDICILVAIIKLIKFTSLKNAVILYITTSLLMIVFIVIIEVLLDTSYEERLQDTFYSPFLFVMPTLTPVPN